MSTTTTKIKFSRAFWVSNLVELFERAAYYGVFIVITLYLSRILGFDDIQSASIAGVFSACLYLLPTFAGALADKIGFRNYYCPVNTNLPSQLAEIHKLGGIFL